MATDLKNPKKNPGVFSCPNEKRIAFDKMGCHYVGNQLLMGSAVKTLTPRTEFKKTTIIYHPSKACIVADNATTANIFNAIGDIAYRHDEGEIRALPIAQGTSMTLITKRKCNILYYDGHVQPQTYQDLKSVKQSAEAKEWGSNSYVSHFQANGFFIRKQ